MRFGMFCESTTVTNKGVFLLTEGIDHVESLPHDKFIDTVRKMSEFTISEKLDGSNLIFGFDNRGRFYTSREAKSGGRFYQVSDYKIQAANNGFRSAHAALQRVAPQLKAVVATGEQVEVEVLFGRQPNAIVYGSNYIAFLRMLPGDSNQAPDQSKIKQLDRELKNSTVNTSVEILTTTDGVNIEKRKINQSWKFSSVSYIEGHYFAKVDIEQELREFDSWLKHTNPVGNLGLTNEQIITVNLTSVPMKIRSQVKDERENLITQAESKFKLPIKEKFLNNVLRSLKPALRDVNTEDHEDVGVEGVVLLNPRTLQQFKIVDTDVFTIINQFNFAIRNEIKATTQGRSKFEASLGIEGDVFGNMLKRIAGILGIVDLGHYIKIKRTLRNYIGETQEETIENIVKVFKEKELVKLQVRVNDAIEQGLEELDESLKKYHKEWRNYKHTLKTGKTIKYTDEIHNRTLMVFAEVREEMKQIQEDIKRANTLGDVAVALYGKQLRTLHQKAH